MHHFVSESLGAHIIAPYITVFQINDKERVRNTIQQNYSFKILFAAHIKFSLVVFITVDHSSPLSMSIRFFFTLFTKSINQLLLLYILYLEKALVVTLMNVLLLKTV